jgi:hypothetical protein
VYQTSDTHPPAWLAVGVLTTKTASNGWSCFLALFHCVQGLAVKYLGSSCQADVCELGCTGQHQFYRARILQPRAVPDPTNSSSSSADAASLAASLSQAEAATSGRPVLLILDLHPRLRAGSLQELLQVETAEPLQVGL